nr:CRS1 / YhbY (CRM) domain protein [Candidatus Prometheoarchaeum syntrophicum]
MERFMEIKNGRAQINIGKNGITPTFLEHLKIILKKEKIVKIKILKEISMEQGNEPLINKIIEDLNVFVLDSRGNTFIISKKKISDIHIPKKYLLLKNTFHPPSKKKKEEIEVIETEKIPNESNFSEPDYIDYDNKELVAEIDKQSDILYGSVSEPVEKESDQTRNPKKAKFHSKKRSYPKSNNRSRKQIKNKRKFKKGSKKKKKKF